MYVIYIYIYVHSETTLCIFQTPGKVISNISFLGTMPTAGNCALRKINAGILSACLIGLGLSYYAYVVETKKEQDDSYKAMCDISENISCTKVFMTE